MSNIRNMIAIKKGRSRIQKIEDQMNHKGTKFEQLDEEHIETGHNFNEAEIDGKALIFTDWYLFLPFLLFWLNLILLDEFDQDVVGGLRKSQKNYTKTAFERFHEK